MAEEQEKPEKKDDLVPKFSRNTMIVRRNLLGVSTLTLMALIFDLEINAKNFLGIGIDGLEKNELYLAALVLLAYFTAHFTLNVASEWRELSIGSIIIHPIDTTLTDFTLTPFKAIRQLQHKIWYDGNEPGRHTNTDEQETIETMWEKDSKNIKQLKTISVIRFYGIDILFPFFLSLVAISWLSLSMIGSAFFPHT